MTLKHPGIDHDISIDFSASIETEISVGVHGWPRQATRNVLSEKQIDKAFSAGLHMVPKSDKFWYLSYSKAVTALLKYIDGANECRKKCHKILKKDFRTWQSKSSTGLATISTYLFKVYVIVMFQYFSFVILAIEKVYHTDPLFIFSFLASTFVDE